jgi:hypothetical protein
MITVRISATDERTIRGAETLDEFKGLQQLLLERLEQSRALSAFRKSEPVEKKEKAFGWRAAISVCREVLGDNLTVPPFPDSTWYQRIYRTMKHYGMTEDYVRRLAEHARDCMRLPIKLDFMIGQHERILAGEWDTGKAPPIRMPRESWMTSAKEQALPSD